MANLLAAFCLSSTPFTLLILLLHLSASSTPPALPSPHPRHLRHQSKHIADEHFSSLHHPRTTKSHHGAPTLSKKSAPPNYTLGVSRQSASSVFRKPLHVDPTVLQKPLQTPATLSQKPLQVDPTSPQKPSHFDPSFPRKPLHIPPTTSSEAISLDGNEFEPRMDLEPPWDSVILGSPFGSGRSNTSLRTPREAPPVEYESRRSPRKSSVFESGGGHATLSSEQSFDEEESSSTLRPPLVTTDCGDVMGFWVNVSTGGRVAAFLGIPYSEPPVGDLRFRAPVPVNPWRKTKDATKFGPLCIQPGNQFVWDAVRFPSPTTAIPQHQTARPKNQRHSSQQQKMDERGNQQFSEPSLLFSTLIGDRTPSQRQTLENQTSTEEESAATTASSAERTSQMSSAPVMRRRRMRNYDMSEDCLTLNIYTPQLNSNVSSGLPILFFIHGGSYYMNGGRLYPGEELAARGAVVVTFNYRLGPFGFLSTGEPSCRGNWGLLDQAEALRWVRRNAMIFGGDGLNSLCIVGNSAGAASVLLHMVSPLTKGLFSCAVAMSGCSGAPWAMQPRPLRHAKSLATRLGCPHPNRRPHHAVACLRTFSAQLIAENSDLEDGLGVAFAPVVDGVGVGGGNGGRRGAEGSEMGNVPEAFIPDDPRRLMAEGKFAQVPFLSGLTRDEVSIWFSNFGPTMEKRLMRVFLDKDIRQLLNGTGLPSINSVALSHAAAHLYLWGGRTEGGSDESRTSEGHRSSEGMRGTDVGARGSTLAVADFISDVGLKAPCIYDMELIARSNQKLSFFYEFQYHSVDDARTDKQEWIGAYHESELQFLFGEPFLGYSNHLRAANDREVSEMIMSLWINFAKHGHPTPQKSNNGIHGDIEWKPFTSTHRQYLVLAYRPRMAENYLTERMVFWNHIADAFRRYPMPPYCTSPPVTVPPMVNLPLPPSDHLRWIFWLMAAGNVAFLLTVVFCLAKRARRRTRSPTNLSASAGV